MHRAEEDYLKAIYEMTYEQDIDMIKTSELSSKFAISDQSVHEMIKKLVLKKLVIFYPYKGIQLTRSGLEEAVKMIRSHRLWEVFLTEKLGFSWKEVHEDAEKLEHATSLKVLNELDAFLGFPKFCQHGNPIPDEKGHILHQKHKPLTQCIIGIPYIISRVTDNNQLLSFLDQKNIKLGDIIIIDSIDTYNEMMSIQKNDHKIHMHLNNAQLIYANPYHDKHLD